MVEERYFFQDFLLEDMPVDEHDYPNVLIKTYSNYNTESIFDAIISFDKLLRMNKHYEWDALFSEIKGKKILINDDVPISNSEVKLFKDFYLGVYYFNLSKYCEECMVLNYNYDKSE